MSQLRAPSVISESIASLPPLRIGYAGADAASLLNEPDVLAVIAFGALGDATQPADPRCLRVGLDQLGDAACEVWRGRAPVRSGICAEVRWSCDGDYGFVSIELDEESHAGISGAAEHAYRALTEFLRTSAAPHVLRLWNYFDAINDGSGDDERYRLFCVGRARGMAGTWQDAYPAATAIGRRDGVRTLQVYALTARAPGVAVENPRQINAWRYPREYGPTAPTFARGMVTPAAQLLISGTAAVVGAESQHEDDIAAQLEETLANLASLLAAAHPGNGAQLGAGSLLKAYVRDRADAALLRERLRTQAPGLEGLLLLEGEICRRELLTEIDGVHG